jgi:hypothetical protein
VIDAIKAKIPWESETLLPRRDLWGAPIPNARDITGTGLTAIWARQQSTDPVNIEMLRLGIAPSPVGRRLSGQTLTDRQYDEYAQLAGQMTKTALDRNISSPQWRMMPDSGKIHVIDNAFAAVARGRGTSLWLAIRRSWPMPRRAR